MRTIVERLIAPTRKGTVDVAVVMMMRWSGVTVAQYDDVRRITNFEGDQPVGGLLHVCTHDDESLRITDVWESAEGFQQFVETRLMPVVAQLGIQAEPQIEIYPAHNIFTPGYTAKS
jgi:hypothetical protein